MTEAIGLGTGILDITIGQGATFEQLIVWKQSNGTPVNLTSVTAIAGQVRPTPESATVSATFVMTIEGDPEDGTIKWFLSATASSAIPLTCGDQAYDIEVTFSDGNVVRLLQGAATISPGVTR